MINYVNFELIKIKQFEGGKMDYYFGTKQRRSDGIKGWKESFE